MTEPRPSRVAAATETLGCIAVAVLGGFILAILLGLWGAW